MGLIGWRQPPGDFQAPLIQMLCGERARPATIDEAAKPPITVGAARKGTVFATVLIASGCRARTNRPSAGIVGSKISLFCCRCSVCHCPLRSLRQTGSLRRYHIKSDWSNCRLQQRSVFLPDKSSFYDKMGWRVVCAFLKSEALHDGLQLQCHRN